MKSINFEINHIGQFFITGISGTSLSDDEAHFISENNIGGIILFRENYESPAQIAELINHIQTLRGDYPLFISVDHEGGRVIRFRDQFTQFPAMYELSKLGSPKLVYEAHAIMGTELSACGINLSYSPVCDIWSNEKNQVIGDRAFGKDVDNVEKYISAAIRGLQTEGVLAVAKHFPGHGDTLKDSHHSLPFVNKSLTEIKNFELKPFQKAARSKVSMMMMAHLQVDAIDTEMPTSLSRNAYDFLRKELRFNRPICTDDMVMGAITNKFETAQACWLALEAGADLLIIKDFEETKKAYDLINANIRDKKIDNEKLSDKITRIYSLKNTHLSNYQPTYIPDLSRQIGTPDFNNFQLNLTEKIAAKNS